MIQPVAWLVLAGLLVQFYFAGAALFGATTFQPHRMLGDGLAVAILLLMVVVAIARPERRVVGLTIGLTVLTIIQVSLPSLRTGLPWVAAFHVLNAVTLVLVTAGIAYLAPHSPAVVLTASGHTGSSH